MHPFMPFITEEIWEKITGGKEGRIIIAPWPVTEKRFNFLTEAEETETFKELVYKIRNVRGEMNIPPDKKASVVFKTSDQGITAIIKRETVHIQALARVETVTIDPAYEPDNTDASAVLRDVEIYIPLKGLIDVEKEKARLAKEIAKVQEDFDRVEKKLSNENFIGKAPEAVIEKEKQKKDEFSEILSKLKESLAKL